VTVTLLSCNGHILVTTVPLPNARHNQKDFSMDMEVTELANMVTCIRLQGRLDAPGVDRIDTRFTAATVAAGRDAVLDLSGVTFLASMGIRMLISSARALKLKGAKLVLFGAQDLVQNVLEQAAIDQIIPVVTTEDRALEQLQA
jgi:anti-anti-sigma factor